MSGIQMLLGLVMIIFPFVAIKSLDLFTILYAISIMEAGIGILIWGALDSDGLLKGDKENI